MKARVAAVLFGLLVSLNASAGWFGNDNGWDDSDWPEWTPMYWMEEMFDSFDDDDDYYRYGPRGYAPYGYAQPYAMAPYQGQVPHAQMPAPVAPQAPEAPAAAK
jgi:hypothetical protein